MIEILNTPELCITLAALFPTVLFASVNTHFYSNKQIARSLLMAGAVGLALGLAMDRLITLACRVWNLDAALLEPICGSLIGFAVLYVFGERTYKELLLNKVRRKRLAIFLSVLPAVLIAASPWPELPVLLLLFTITSAYDLCRNLKKEKQPLIYEISGSGKDLDSYQGAGEFKRRPNIYYLFLESMHSEAAVELIYGVKNNREIAGYLRDKDFTVYEDALSNAPDTRGTIGVIFENSLSVNYQSELASPPVTLKELLRNGYKINIIDSGPYSFQRYSDWAHCCSFNIPRWVKKIYAFCGPLLSQSRWLRKIAGGIDPFTTEDAGYDFQRDIYCTTRERMAKISQSRPEFFMIRFGATHRNRSNKNDWDNTYISSFELAKTQLKAMVDMITAQDPEAVIVASGDHGGKKYLELLGVENINAAIAGDSNLNHELIVQDFFGVLMAVRWPQSSLPKPKIHSHINIFSHLFALLADRPGYLPVYETEISLHGWHQVAENGRSLPEFKLLQGGAYDFELAQARESLAKNSNNPDTYSKLAGILLRGDPRQAEQVLRDGLTRFPHNPVLLFLLSKACLFNGKLQYAHAILTKLCRIEPTAELFLLRAEALILQNKIREALAVLLEGAAVLQVGRTKLQAKLLELFWRQKEFSAGIEYYKSNCALSCKEEFLPLLVYARLLAAQGRLDEAIKCWETLPVHPTHILYSDEDINKVRPYFYDMIFYYIQKKDWEAAQKWAEVCYAASAGNPAWVSLFQFYCLERQGKIMEAVAIVLAKIRANDPHVLVYSDFLGMLALRNNLCLSELTRAKELALHGIEKKVRDIVSSGLFDLAWYRRQYQTVQSELHKKRRDMHPILHYLHYGVFEGACPNPYFDPHHVIRSCEAVKNLGVEPLLYFMNFGDEDLVDPSPFFFAKPYVYAHPEIRKNNVNFLAHFLREQNAPDFTPDFAAGPHSAEAPPEGAAAVQRVA